MEEMSWEEAMRRKQEVVDVSRHELKRFIYELKEDQLATFFGVLCAITGEDGQNFAHHITGMVTTVMETKFGVCWACGAKPCRTDHAVEGLLMNPNEKQPHPAAAPESLIQVGDADLAIGQVGLLSARQIAQMEEYGLDDLREEATERLIGFICIRCREYRFPSIEDRMMSKSDKTGCPGCVLHEKFG